jgi:hypothetical protein
MKSYIKNIDGIDKYYEGVSPLLDPGIEVPNRPSIYHTWNGTEWIIDNDFALSEIRKTRDILLFGSDKYVLTDFPISETKKNEWKVYRQALRDFPSVVDLNNVVWPTPPSE